MLPDGRLTEAEKVLRAAADLDEVVDPCCQYLSLDDDSNHSTTQLAAKNGNNQPQAQQVGVCMCYLLRGVGVRKIGTSCFNFRWRNRFCANGAVCVLNLLLKSACSIHFLPSILT